MKNVMWLFGNCGVGYFTKLVYVGIKQGWPTHGTRAPCVYLPGFMRLLRNHRKYY